MNLIVIERNLIYFNNMFVNYNIKEVFVVNRLSFDWY